VAEDSEARTGTLEALARSQFEQLSEAERRLLHAVPLGQPAFCGPSQDDDDPANDPTNASNWAFERDIRAELIRWLCVDHEVVRTIDPRGLRVHASRIVGEFDLSYVSIRFPLDFERCVFNAGIDLRYLKVAALNLSGSQVQSVNAEGAIVAGDIFMGEGFHARGEVRLLGAQVSGDLECSGGTFENPTGKALSADRIKVIGDVSLTNGFSAQGEVRLLVAQIGGTFNCSGGSFQHPKGLALNCDSAEVKGSVFLKEGFSSEGGTSFLGARIGTNFDCGGGVFKNPSALALTLDHTQVTGSIFLRKGFSAEGEVWLYGAQIGSNLDCNSGSFKNARGRALTADSIRIEGAFLLRKGFCAEGQVLLRGAYIGRDLDCDGGVFKNHAGGALTADRARVEGSVFLRKKVLAEGEVRLVGAHIGSNLECDDSTFKNPLAVAINAEGVEVGGSVFLRDGFEAQGEVSMLAAVVGDSLDCQHGAFSAASGKALFADRARIRGSVFLNNNFSAVGEVKLLGAQIGGNLDCGDGKFKNADGIAIYADNARVDGHVFLRGGFSAEGRVILFGAQIDGGMDCARGEFTSLELSTAGIKGIFRWIDVRSAERTRLDLKNASVGAIADEEASWPKMGNLSLDGFNYARIVKGPINAKTRLDWLNRADQFTLQPYQQLARALRETGDSQGAREVLFKMEERRRKTDQKRHSYWRIWDWMLRWTIGYGQRSEWALLWLLGLTLFGSLLSGCAYLGGAVCPNEKEAYEAFERQGESTAYYPRFNALIYSFEHSFPLVDLGVKEHWMLKPGKPATVPELRWAVFRTMRDATFRNYYLFRLCAPQLLRWWQWFQIVAGWVLATLFVAGLTGIVKSGS
jgi:hypothetical protein